MVFGRFVATSGWSLPGLLRNARISKKVAKAGEASRAQRGDEGVCTVFTRCCHHVLAALGRTAARFGRCWVGVVQTRFGTAALALDTLQQGGTGVKVSQALLESRAVGDVAFLGCVDLLRVSRPSTRVLAKEAAQHLPALQDQDSSSEKPPPEVAERYVSKQ